MPDAAAIEGSGKLTPESIIYDLSAAASPAISPDGSTIVFALTSTDRESGSPRAHLWLVNSDGKDLRQLTTIGDMNANPSWSPDGERVAFVSHGQTDGQHSIRAIPIRGGESREIVTHDRPPGTLAWSPDGKRLAYAVGVDFAADDQQNGPPPPRVVRSLQYKEDLRGVQNRVRSQVFVVAIDGGEPRQVTDDERDHADPQWSPDGTRLAVKVVEEVLFHQRLRIVDVELGDVDLVTEPTGSVGCFAWTPDGASVLFDGGPNGTIQSDWYRFDLASGEVVRLTDDLHYQPEGGFAGFMPPSQPVWLANGLALTHGFREGRSGFWTVDPATGEIGEVAWTCAMNSGLSADATGRYVVQAHGSPDSFGEVVLFDAATGQSRVVTSINRDVFDRCPPAPTGVIRTESAGETIEAWVTYPPDFDEAKRYPVVLEVHGEPYGHFGYAFNPAAQTLAAEGMIVVSSNPRGSTSYGRRFAELVNMDMGGGDWADVQAALDTVLGQPYADCERTAIFGYSYGGYMTAWAIGQTDRFAAAVCGAPLYDLASFYGSSDVAHILAPMLWGGTPADRLEWLGERSPSTHIFNAETPTLILCGEADVRCPISQSEQMFAALKIAGVDVEFVRYPNSNHMFPFAGPPSYRVDYLTRARDWLLKYLGSPARQESLVSRLEPV